PLLPDQSGTASITLPDIITVGVMGRPRGDLALSFDANLVLWSTYDRIDIKFQTTPAADHSIVSNGQNAFTLRAGADWSFPRRPAPGASRSEHQVSRSELEVHVAAERVLGRLNDRDGGFRAGLADGRVGRGDRLGQQRLRVGEAGLLRRVQIGAAVGENAAGV